MYPSPQYTSPHNSPSTIDMLTPSQTCDRLRLTDDAVIELVNRGDLRAYRFGRELRFRASDVRAASTAFAAA